MARELTVGTPIKFCDGPVPEGWVEVKCPLCEKPMRAQQRNVKPKQPGDEVVLVCYTCLSNGKFP